MKKQTEMERAKKTETFFELNAPPWKEWRGVDGGKEESTSYTQPFQEW